MFKKLRLTEKLTQIDKRMSTSDIQKWSIGKLIKLNENSQLVKARIQRKKRWTTEQSGNFNKFIAKHKNCIIPFLVNEKITNLNAKKFIVFDGNNRSNAIIDFLQNPLRFYEHLIPACFSEKVKKILRDASLATLTKPRYRFTQFCRDHKIDDEYANSKTQEADEEAFDTLAQALADMKFEAIDISVAVYSNITDEEMCDIYESINTGGTKLTRQELLASSTTHILFTESTLKPFRDLLKILNTEYYGDMNMNEKLSVEVSNSTESMNLFEVLVSFQIWLSNKYDSIPAPCEEKGLDIIFKLYETLIGKFDSHITPERMNTFLDIIDKGCSIIQTNLRRFFEDRIGYPQITKKCRNYSGNRCNLILTYIFTATEHGISESVMKDTVNRVMLYHTIITAIAQYDKKINMPGFSTDSLRYESGGPFIPGQLEKIKKTRAFDRTPTDEDILKAVTFMIMNDIKPSTYATKAEKRSRPTSISDAKALAFSAFSSNNVPIHSLDGAINNDHIAPFSSNWDNTYELDINRIGNLVLIPEKPNKLRGKKPITDQFIQDNNLKYMEYPTGTKYSEVVIDGFIQKDAYNEMCQNRERIYSKAIMKLLNLK